MFFRRILRALCLTLFLLMLVACSGSQASSSSPVPPPESGSSAAESSPQPSSEPEPPSPSAAPDEESADAPAEFEPAEAVEASGGTTADLTAVVTGEIHRQISGISGSRAGTSAERDSLAALLSSLKPENVSLIVIANPLSSYQEEALLSDEDAAALVEMTAKLPAPGVFETLGNPATGGFLWTLYFESGDQAVLLSNDGFWLTASIKGQSQMLVFDSAPCKAQSEALSTFLDEQLSAAQRNILTLS